jgi:predicted uridylate kinase
MFQIIKHIGLEMRIGISFGGKMIFNNGKINTKLLTQFSSLLKNSKNEFLIGVGGGEIAKILIEGAKELKANSFLQDYIGITATIANALIMKAATGGAIYSFEEILKKNPKEKIIIVHGTIPGITTDSDTVLACEALGVKKLINFSDTILFDKDPKKFKDAKPIKHANYDFLIELAKEADKREARENFIFDLLACKIAKRANIELHFVSNLKDLELAIEGKKHNGSIVHR